MNIPTRLTLLAVSLLAACSGDSPSPVGPHVPETPVLTIRILGIASDIAIDDRMTLTAEVVAAPSAVGVPVLSWTSSDPSILAVEPGPGVTAVIEGKAAGVAVVTVSAANAQATRKVTVYRRPALVSQAVIWQGPAVTILAVPDASRGSAAHAINDSGQAVGVSYSASGSSAVVWSADGVVRELGRLPGDLRSSATGISSNGMVVGWSSVDNMVHRGFLWTSDGGMRDIGTLPNDIRSIATGVNASGTVAGASMNGSNGWRPVRWTAATGMQPLPSLPGYVGGWANAINDAGDIVGYSGDYYDATRATLWTADGRVLPIGGCQSPSTCLTDARAVARNTTIVGDIDGHPSMWDPGDPSQVTTLGGLFDLGFATSLNDKGEVAGYTFSTGFVTRAFRWSRASGAVYLAIPAGHEMSAATGMNNAGQVVGYVR